MSIIIMEDWHSERTTAFRAYVGDTPDADTVCPLVGYCSPGGSFRTIREAARDAARRSPGSPVYRGFHSSRPSRLILAGKEAE